MAKILSKGIYFEGFKGLIPTHDNNYILMGTTQQHDSVTITNASGWLMKINPQGNEIWSRTHAYYGAPDTNSYFEDIVNADDGGFAVCGWVINPAGNGNDAWLVKTDCFGFVENAYPVTAGFDFSTNEFTATFTNQSDSACWYRWFFGDGDSSTQKNPAHTYADTGLYNVTLIAFNADKSDTITDTVRIYLTGSKPNQPPESTNPITIFLNISENAIIVNINNFEQYQTKNLYFTIYDVSGREIYKDKIKENNFIINKTPFKSGMYFYKFNNYAGKMILY